MDAAAPDRGAHAAPTKSDDPDLRPSDRPGRADAGPVGAPPVPPGPAALLHLQRHAGNAAVSALLRRPNPLPTRTGDHARSPATDASSEAEPGSANESESLEASASRLVAASSEPPQPPQQSGGAGATHEASPEAARRDTWQLDPAIQRTVVQRQNKPAGVDKNEALTKAVQLANKNSLLKLKFPVKAPGGIKVFGGLELKKIELEVDTTAELSSPQLSSSKTTKVSGGVQNVGQQEADPTKRSATEAQATVYALEAEQKFGASGIAEKLSFKAKGEYGTWTPTDSTIPNKREFKGTLGLQFADQGFSVEVQFIPVAYDREKKGPDAFKMATFALKVAKEFEHKLPGLFDIDGVAFDVKLKAKVTGTIEIGPDYDKVSKALFKVLGKEAQEQVAKAAAKEESEKFIETLIREIAEDECKDIADKTARKNAQKIVETRLTAEVEKRQLKMMAAEEANFFIRRELTEAAGKELSIFAIRAEATSITQRLAKPMMTELRAAVVGLAKVGVEQFTVRAVARNVAKTLVAGPADFVLVGVQILYNYVDTVVKDLAMKELGLRVMACRENYVTGYTTGLRDGPASGGGGGGGGGGGSGGGSGTDANLEGAAFLLGLQEGANQNKAVVDRHLADATVRRDEAEKAIKDVMSTATVNRSAIVAKASPKLQEMILSSYEKQFSGGILRALFGEDFKESKDYKYFKSYVESFLKEDASNRIRTRLKRKGDDREVYVTLVMLDSTSDRAKKFRTEDGKHFVTLSGDTENFSGWVTEDGKPLEDIYMSQGDANASSSDEAKAEHLKKMKAKLAACSLNGDARYNGLGYTVSSAALSGDPGDLEFEEFLRSPDAQGMTVAQAGLRVNMFAFQQYQKEITGWDTDKTVVYRASGPATDPSVEVYMSGGVLLSMNDRKRAKENFARDVCNRRLAALPKLV